jgi:hypothetical protein
MSTRGALVFVLKDEEKVIYSHSDSYPEGLGADVLRWLHEALADEDALYAQVAALAPVPDREPTEAEREQHRATTDRNVSTGRDWYALLRDTQGDPAAILACGLYEDAGDFPTDSLFCEWAYVVDLDARRFEVYKGFQDQPHKAGRWGSRRPGRDSAVTARSATATGNGYYPVRRIADYPFDTLPDPDTLPALLA